VFSDYGAIEMLVTMHRTAEDLSEAGRQALVAGMDMEAPHVMAFGKRLQKLVAQGQVSEHLIDEAVSNILRVKFLAGVFEKPFADVARVDKIVNAPEQRKLARRAAEEAIVLLKNEAAVLPLSRSIQSIAVLGPNSDSVELGDYALPRPGLVSPVEAIRQIVSRRTKVRHVPGCGLFELVEDGIADAVDAAAESDVAVVFVGEASTKPMGIGWEIEGVETRPALCGEGFDRTDLDLPGVQQKLVEAVVATGTPTVVVLINGRPLSISWIADHVPAILEAWYPGEKGSAALADILFGKVNPSGKLPVSFPRAVGQVPNYYNHKPSGGGYYKRPGQPGKPGRDYVFMSPTPLFPFGHGLSYTRFRYSNLRVTPKVIPPAGRVTVRVDVMNAGRMAGKETVQLYVNDVVSSTTTPVKALRGFVKVHLKPGQKRTVEFTLGPDDLALLDEHMERAVEPGDFEVMVGPLVKTFRVQ
jgi:beta-glucosidase